jgi:hypothetical protein
MCVDWTDVILDKYKLIIVLLFTVWKFLRQISRKHLIRMLFSPLIIVAIFETLKLQMLLF